jgi:ABC-type uncharacterized transport system ATPase subunit
VRVSESVVLERVSKTFDDVAAVDDVSHEVGSGEFSRCLGRPAAARQRRCA